MRTWRIAATVSSCDVVRSRRQHRVEPARSGFLVDDVVHRDLERDREEQGERYREHAHHEQRDQVRAVRFASRRLRRKTNRRATTLSTPSRLGLRGCIARPRRAHATGARQTRPSASTCTTTSGAATPNRQGARRRRPCPRWRASTRVTRLVPDGRLREPAIRDGGRDPRRDEGSPVGVEVPRFGRITGPHGAMPAEEVGFEGAQPRQTIARPTCSSLGTRRQALATQPAPGPGEWLEHVEHTDHEG